MEVQKGGLIYWPREREESELKRRRKVKESLYKLQKQPLKFFIPTE